MTCAKIVLAGLVAIVATASAWPPPDEVAKTKPIVDELMSAKGALAPADKAEAASAFAEEANGEAAKYLLLRRAVELYAKAGDDGRTADAFQKLVKDVKDVPPAVQERILLDAGRTLAKRVRPLRTEALFKGVRALVWAEKELAAARMELTGSKKDDPAANLRAGNALAVLGDWPKALEHLCGAQGKIASVADHEINSTVTADKLANAWWKASAATESDYVKNAYRRHSVELYRKALEADLLVGLNKTLAENRIAEFEKADDLSAGSAAGVTSGAARPVAATERTSSKLVIVAQNNTSDVKYKFNYRLDTNGNAILCGNPCVSPKPEGELVVPDKIDGHTVTKIDDMAFIGCDKMTSIILPPHLEEIITTWFRRRCSGAIFEHCFALASIDIAKTNPRFTSENGALYTKDKKWLGAYPKNRSEITLARETTGVGANAFNSCMFKTVKIPDSVEGINFWAFRKCPNLEVVEFPKNFKGYIGAYVFDSCPEMKKVVFYGDAPAIGVRRTKARPNLFWASPNGIVVEVRKGTRGWKGKGSTELPEFWPLEGNPKRRIRYIP